MVGCGFSILAVLASCFPGPLLPYRSSGVAFFACGHHASRISITLFSVDVVRMKSYRVLRVQLLCTLLSTWRVLIKKLYLVQKRIVAGIVDVF